MSPVLVGRAGQLASLEYALATTRRGEPATVLIGGAAGVGKSRLVSEFTARAADGGRVLAGGCLNSALPGWRSRRSRPSCGRWCATWPRQRAHEIFALACDSLGPLAEARFRQVISRYSPELAGLARHLTTPGAAPPRQLPGAG